MIRNGRDTALRALAMMALLVLGLGLPQLLVICIHADGIGRVEFVHAAGACCAEEVPHAAGACCADHGSVALASSDGGCEHVDFALELAPPPAGRDHPDEPPPVFAWTADNVQPRTVGTAVPHPPATGPPRADRRTLLRATTLLLL